MGPSACHIRLLLLSTRHFTHRSPSTRGCAAAWDRRPTATTSARAATGMGWTAATALSGEAGLMMLLRWLRLLQTDGPCGVALTVKHPGSRFASLQAIPGTVHCNWTALIGCPSTRREMFKRQTELRRREQEAFMWAQVRHSSFLGSTCSTLLPVCGTRTCAGGMHTTQHPMCRLGRGGAAGAAASVLRLRVLTCPPSPRAGRHVIGLRHTHQYQAMLAAVPTAQCNVKPRLSS